MRVVAGVATLEFGEERVCGFSAAGACFAMSRVSLDRSYCVCGWAYIAGAQTTLVYRDRTGRVLPPQKCAGRAVVPPGRSGKVST